MGTHLSQRRFEARPAVERFADQALRRALGWGDARLQITVPEGGSHSLLYFVSAEGSAPVVVQAFNNPAECEELGEALELGQKRDLPIPKLLRKGSGLLDRARFGSSLLAMSLAPGEALRPGIPNRLAREALASALARLHRVREKRWGKPGRLRGGSIREEWYRAVLGKLEELRGGLPGLDRNMMALADRWFRETLASLTEPSEFDLCHRNLAPSNVVWDKATGVTLVDCAPMEFLRAAADLADARLLLLDEDEAAWADFLNQYFQHFPKPSRAPTEREIGFFLALSHLLKLRRRIFAGPDDERAIQRLMKAVTRPIGG